jgi:ATP-dependent 26S proteasome regulatory subunit
LNRILVDLPNTENRVKILRVILAEEELEENFDYKELSRMTDGYSGSDLKVL